MLYKNVFRHSTLRGQKLLERALKLSEKVEILELAPSGGAELRRGITAAKGSLWMPIISQEISYGSTAERSFLLACRLDHQVEHIAAQPFSIRFKIAGSHRERKYTPDYLVRKNLSLGASRVCIGSSLASAVCVEVKRETDLRYMKRPDVERLAAGYAWGKSSADSDFTTYIDPIEGSDEKFWISHLGYLAAEPETAASLLLRKCLSVDLSMNVSDAWSFLERSGFDKNEVERAVILGIAKGWAELDTLGYPIGSHTLSINPYVR